MDKNAILADISTALSVAAKVSMVAAAAGLPFAGAVATGIQIATGVAAEAPEAMALWDQFNAGTMPSQAELDAYAANEDSAYAKLMADIAAARAKQSS